MFGAPCVAQAGSQCRCRINLRDGRHACARPPSLRLLQRGSVSQTTGNSGEAVRLSYRHGDRLRRLKLSVFCVISGKSRRRTQAGGGFQAWLNAIASHRNPESLCRRNFRRFVSVRPHTCSGAPRQADRWGFWNLLLWLQKEAGMVSLIIRVAVVARIAFARAATRRCD